MTFDSQMQDEYPQEPREKNRFEILFDILGIIVWVILVILIFAN